MITIQVKILDIRAIEPVVMLTKDTASKLRLRHTENITLRFDQSELVAAPVVVQGIIEDDVIGISQKHAAAIGVNDGSMITVLARRTPQSYDLIKRKIAGHPWSSNDVRSIVNDISRRKYTSLEVASFALVSQFQGYSPSELADVAKSMAEAGTQFNFQEPVYDKHSIGGIPGNKITPIIVAIVAAAGLLIPKTSSRAITSPSGTADTMEVLCNVNFTPDEIIEIAPKSRGMIIWNAPLNLSPLDDIVIDVKRQLGIDPPDQMLASIVSTKIAMGVDSLVFDLPTGPMTKMSDRSKAINFANSLIGLCRQVGIKVEAAITLGDQPLGYNIGPALEAQEALKILETAHLDDQQILSVKEKSVELAGILLELGGLAQRNKGMIVAEQILNSGKALQKFQEIVEAQGGDKGVTHDKVPIGDYSEIIPAVKDGYISGISNHAIISICKAAGAPKDKQAGIILKAKLGEFVKEGDPLFSIFSNSESRLSLAIQVANSQTPFSIEGMVIQRIGSIPDNP